MSGTRQTIHTNTASHRTGRRQTVSKCFKPNQPQKIILGLRETFVKRYIPDRTDEAETRPEEQSEKAESCRENLWNEIQLKGLQRQKQAQEQNKSGQARLVYV